MENVLKRYAIQKMQNGVAIPGNPVSDDLDAWESDFEVFYIFKFLRCFSVGP